VTVAHGTPNAREEVLSLHPQQLVSTAARAFCTVHGVERKLVSRFVVDILRALHASDVEKERVETEWLQRDFLSSGYFAGYLGGSGHPVPLPPALYRAARDLGARGNQMSVAQYLRIASTISRRAPCNLLVWGAGDDVPLWLAANTLEANGVRGLTHVLEGDESWARRAARHPDWPQGGATLSVVDFGTARLRDAERLLRTFAAGGEGAVEAVLRVALPDAVWRVPWDVIVIDGPQGFDVASHPGRMASIFTTYLMARSAAASSRSGVTDVFVHDADRWAERAYADTFFGHTFAATDGHLRHYALYTKGGGVLGTG
jgi:uncharacterized protein (TIGR01627 family)